MLFFLQNIISAKTYNWRRDAKPTKTLGGRVSMSFPLRYLQQSIAKIASTARNQRANHKGTGILAQTCASAPLQIATKVFRWVPTPLETYFQHVFQRLHFQMKHLKTQRIRSGLVVWRSVDIIRHYDINIIRQKLLAHVHSP